MRIDGIHYEHELSVGDLENIRGHLMVRHAQILGDIALVNSEIDRKTQDQLPFEPRDGEAIPSPEDRG